VVPLFLCVSAVYSAEPGSPPPAAYWLARPWHTEPKILAWAAKYPQWVSLQTHKTRGGRTAYAVSVTGPERAGRPKFGLLFTQPHAHEPAATAGMMDFLAELLDGAHLDGRPSYLPRKRILDELRLIFIPDGNPDGRARAPADWWDGSQYSNQEFLKFAFGREADGTQSPRLGRWSTQERRPALIGFVYEAIGEHEYVEPNRDLDSTFFQLIQRLLGMHEYAAHVDLHQTEFERSTYNAMAILPFMQADLPEPIRTANQRLGEALVEGWRSAGAQPKPQVVPLGYREDQLQYFRKCWSDLYRARPHVTVEIQNNNVRTPPAKQMELMEIAVRTTAEWFLAKESQGDQGNHR